MSMTGQGSGSEREPSAAAPDQPEQDHNLPQPHAASRGAEGFHEP